MVGLDNPLHIALLLLVLLLIFGAKRLPELGRSLGSGLRGFKESVSGETGALGDDKEHAEPVSQLTHAAELPGAAAESATGKVAETVGPRSAT
jgi:sec-independent protein translocase protein TatA